MQIHLLRGEDKADDLFLETLRAVAEQNKWRLNSGNLYMQNLQKKNLLLDLDNDACKSAHLNLVYLETPIHFTRFIEAYRSTLKRAPSSLDLYIFCPYYDHEQSADIASFKTLHYFVAPENPNSLKNYLLNVSGQSKSMESSISSLLHGEFSRIVDYSAIISITDTTGAIIYANGNFCRISGYSRNELIGKNHSILKSGRHVESKYRNLWQTISSGKPWRGYFCNKNKANEEYWVDSVIYPMKAPSGEVKSYVSVRYDVTKEMRLKARLIESDKRFRVSHSFANVGSWEWDIETNAIYWSEEIYKLFGYEKPLLEANYDNFINAVHPDDRSLVQANVDACINEGTEYSVEHRVVYPDGTIRWLSERGHAVRDQNGTPKRMLGVVSDIHELKEAQETAIRAEKLKSSFISTLSHEIRNPLNALAGYNQLISDADRNPAIQTYSNKIKKIVEHISGILSDINLNARLESGNIVQTIEPIDLRTLVDESLSLMGKPDNNVTIVTEEITGSVLAEAQHLRQVILNLLSNACKYNRKNGHIYIRSMKRADDAIRLEIEDTGYGIAQENISAIFQPYERLAWQKSEVDGLGLGLPICKLLIKGMKGTIGATSKINCGSTFWIELADAKVPPKVTTTESNPPKQQELPKNVLVLEDNEFNQEFMGEQLKNLKVSATFSTNGKSGLEILSKGTYDLVITDLNMPIMGGIEFIQRVRSHTDKRVRDLPIVVISADNSYSHRIRDIYKASFLEKPFSIQELVKTISTPSSENAPSKAQRDLTYPHIISDSIIDEQKMRHFLGDDIVVRDRLLSIYLKALKQTLPKIKPTAGTAEDALQGICHRMYSSSVSIGASPLAEEFSKLSELLKTGYNNTQLESQLQHLFVMTQEVIAFLENHYTNHHSAANTNKLSEKTVKILVIDDDAFAIEQISSKLAGIGSISFTAERDARTALKQLEYSHFDMIILDIDMPEIDGIQFIRMFAADYKGQALVLYSGESSLVAPVADLIDSYGMCYLGVLNKPSTKLGIYRLLSRYKTNNESQLDNAPPLNIEDNTIKRCVEHGRIQVLYQPQIDIASKKVISAEALSRLIDDSEELIPPSEYLDRLEPLGLERMFACKVAQIAIEQLSIWQQQDHSLKLAINFSMHALEDLNLPDTLKNCCDDNLVKPQNIIVEVTETALSAHPKLALEVMVRLKLLGFTLSIDDFGTGYSSLDKLQKLPFTEMKLDRSYVSTARKDDVSMALLTSSLGLAQQLNMNSVAEGIESFKDFQLIASIGAQSVQGFYFSKPLPPKQFITWKEAFCHDSSNYF